MKETFKKILKRLGNRVVIGQFISIIILIIGVAKIDVESITTWKILFETILGVISNPYIIFYVAYNIFAGTNNPTTPDKY